MGVAFIYRLQDHTSILVRLLMWRVLDGDVGAGVKPKRELEMNNERGGSR